MASYQTVQYTLGKEDKGSIVTTGNEGHADTTTKAIGRLSNNMYKNSTVGFIKPGPQGRMISHESIFLRPGYQTTARNPHPSIITTNINKKR